MSNKWLFAASVLVMLVAVVAPIAMGCGVCEADVYDEASLTFMKELVSQSSAVVIATVNTKESHWLPDSSLIVTKVRLTTSEVLYGKCPKDFEFTQEGGTVGTITLWVSTEKELATGSRYMVMLKEQGGQMSKIGGLYGTVEYDSPKSSSLKLQDLILQAIDEVEAEVNHE